MPSGTDIPFSENDPRFLGRFRYAAAGYIKDLIVARAKTTPNYLTDEIRRLWTIKMGDYEGLSVEYLLLSVKKQRETILSQFVGYGGSIKAPESNDARLLEILRERVATFVDPIPLDTAIAKARQGNKINWKRLARWELLPEIRSSLDLLPKPQPDASSEEEAGGWSKPKGPTYWAGVFGISYGKMKKMLESKQVGNQKLSDRSYRIKVSDLPVKPQ